MRERIKDLYLENKSNTTISKYLGIPRSTICIIVKQFQLNDTIEARSRGGDNRSKLTADEKYLICKWIDDDCFRTLNWIRNEVFSKFNKTVSLSTINRCIQHFHYTLKMVHCIPENRISESTIEQRFNYALEFRDLETRIPSESFVFVDEVGFQVCSRVKKGRAKIGQTQTTTVPQLRTENISVFAAMTKNRMLFFKIIPKP
jgi:transposase